MNGRDKRRRRAVSRSAATKSRDLCWNGCGQPGPHFVPPSMGEPGFYTCTPKSPEEKR